jgi:hypothetical protein
MLTVQQQPHAIVVSNSSQWCVKLVGSSSRQAFVTCETLFTYKTPTGQSGGETGLMVVLINSTLREKMAEKNGAHKTIYSVLPNEKYAVRVRVLVCDCCRRKLDRAHLMPTRTPPPLAG